MRWIDEGFREAPGHYVLQTLMAFFAIVILVVVLGTLTNGTIVAALGASAFIVFAMPKHDTARPRSLIGGHAMCMAIGLACSMPLRMGWVVAGVGQGLLGAVAVSLSIFAMVVFNTEHPPAAGNALAFAIAPVGWGHIGFTLAAVCFLAIVHRVLRGWLRDLA
ncbi:HPP family protein [Candidatus Bipolaricaulota bacterium]